MCSEYKTTTDECSFILKPSRFNGCGVGVFTTHKIAKGTYLRLFGDRETWLDNIVLRQISAVPHIFQDYCVKMGDDIFAPKDFGCMPVGWYMNHDASNPTAKHKDFEYFAMRDLAENEEITTDYNSLEEDKSAIAPYYKQ
ncbi:MAG: SET domain-containing protein [Parcubacteria group bacterium]|jgi:hypothetical protein